MRAARPRAAGLGPLKLAEVDGVALLALEVTRVLGELLAQALVVAHGGERGDGLTQDHRELLRVPRLLDVALHRAGVDGVDQHGQVRVGGEQDAHGVGAQLLRAAEQLDAAHPGMR
jgi:hypothetical protein